MKTLLLTDIPPCSNLTAGIVTAQMARCVPEGELAIFCVQNPHLAPALCPDLAHVPMKVVPKPNEHARRVVKGVPLGTAGAMAVETLKRQMLTPRLVRDAVAYGRAQGATSVWAILQGQTTVRMALGVARGLGVPLRTQVWDPLRWWLDAHKVDPLNARRDMALFDATLKASTACATASWAMARHYEERYGIPALAIIASLDPAIAHQPAPALRGGGELAIGMAGQIYAMQEWQELVAALEGANWQVQGRHVVLRVLGHIRPANVPEANLDFLGWQSQEDTVRLLSERCDILYCPYPFAPEMEEVSRLSFPSKIPTYLAAGRPVLFHGPGYASPASYLTERGAGIVTAGLEAPHVLAGLEQLCGDAALYEALALGARQAFLADFTLARMGELMARFLGRS
jgi:hypothetical protein